MEAKPRTLIDNLQLLLPTLFWTSKVYSPPSNFSVDISFRMAIPLRKLILYFLPDTNSCPSFNHFTLSSGVPLTMHSKVTGSPEVTLTDSVFSTIMAGSERSKLIFTKYSYILAYRIMLSGIS